MPAKANWKRAAVRTALLAHLCRCTGWCTIVEAAQQVEARAQQVEAAPHHGAPGDRSTVHGDRDLEAAARRATLEGGTPQAVGSHVALGAAGFAEDTAPTDALVAMADGNGGWVVAETESEARYLAGKIQGRNSTAALRHPLLLPPGRWELTLAHHVRGARLLGDRRIVVRAREVSRRHPWPTAAPSEGKWAHRYRRWRAGWPTSMAGRCGSCSLVKTPCGWVPNAHPSP